MWHETHPEVEYLPFTSEALQGLPFSEAVRVGKTLYLSGQLGIADGLHLVPGGIAAETRQTMENIKLPARSAFGPTGLAFGARLEIECMAVLP